VTGWDIDALSKRVQALGEVVTARINGAEEFAATAVTLLTERLRHGEVPEDASWWSVNETARTVRLGDREDVRLLLGIHLDDLPSDPRTAGLLRQTSVLEEALAAVERHLADTVPQKAVKLYLAYAAEMDQESAFQRAVQETVAQTEPPIVPFLVDPGDLEPDHRITGFQDRNGTDMFTGGASITTHVQFLGGDRGYRITPKDVVPSDMLFGDIYVAHDTKVWRLPVTPEQEPVDPMRELARFALEDSGDWAVPMMRGARTLDVLERARDNAQEGDDSDLQISTTAAYQAALEMLILWVSGWLRGSGPGHPQDARTLVTALVQQVREQ
jgi:hypothetical protein